ncbi:hypothetical protein D3C71_1985920 [compost metagenome]
MLGAQGDGAVDPHDRAHGALRIVDLRHGRPAQDQVRIAADAPRQLIQRDRRRAPHALQIAAHEPVSFVAANLHERPQRLVVPMVTGVRIAV